MKINPIKVTNLYEANKKNTSIDNTNIKKDTHHNNDKVEISSAGLKHSEAETIKMRLINEITKGTDKDKIQSLKDSIHNGTYNVSSTNIAEAMISGKGKK